MIGSGQIISKRSGRLLLVNKKKQKNFAHPRRADCNAAGLNEQKFFAPLFFKKATSFLSPLL
jgi:hypothetical protein